MDPRWQISLLLLVHVLIASCSTQNTYFVIPTPGTPCPGEPCHTLSEYVAEQYFKHLPVNVTMEFLPGNHALGQTISVTNLIRLTLRGDSSSPPETTSRIICSWPAGFVFTNVTELYITTLAFISCGHSDSAAVNLISVQQSDISNCIFHSNVNGYVKHFQHNGGALNIQKSDTTTNKFQHTSTAYGGALLMATSSSITGNTFKYKSADDKVEAQRESFSTPRLNLAGNTLQNNYGGALFVMSTTLNLTGNIFQNNSANNGGALDVQHGTLYLTENVFQDNSAGSHGGALDVEEPSTLNFIGNTFQNNSAYAGGALFVLSSTLSLTGNIFHNNSARHGGALISVNIYLSGILTENAFYNNSAEWGGALNLASDPELSSLNLTGNVFQNNSAVYGGAVYVDSSTANLTRNTFQNNYAENGGALNVVESSTLDLTGNAFQNNSAYAGGALDVDWSSTVNLTGNTFHNNSAKHGGALIDLSSTINLTGNMFQNNYAILGGAILAGKKSTVRMYERNVIGTSTAQYGGGIAVLDSQLELEGNTIIENNVASYGGGLYVHNTTIRGNMTFTNNSVTLGGGGIYASKSIFYFREKSIISSNSAADGGGLLLSESKFYLQLNTHVYFINNSARRTGGAIKIEEHNPLTDCIYSTASAYDVTVATTTSDCFFQIQTSSKYGCENPSQIKSHIKDLNVMVYFDNNTATEAGTDLHGGSVNNCMFTDIITSSEFCAKGPTSGDIFDDIASSENAPDLSSNPLSICTCSDNRTDCAGSYHHSGPVYPGGTLEVPVIVRGQRNGTTAATIQVINARDGDITVSKLEKIQKHINSCSALKYTIHSRAVATTQKMTLNAQSPCSPTITIAVDIQNCPSGFQLSETHPTCVCALRLQRFTNTCVVANVTLLRAHNADFWVGYDNQSKGLILHPYCPFHYCISEEIYLPVGDSDKQCNYNRSGLLCGRCSKNLSLALGSSRCLQCSNSYLSLLAAFSFAGIALVLLLLILRLTVAAGTINGLVLYANIVTVNPAVFFQPQTTNVLTIFIAWLNLDLGIETCFYDGLDAYVKTWLQFAFPIYVWTLIGMIIVGSHYSGKVAKIFGSNPTAVLATLFLLSYAKLLRTIITALTFTFLEYPHNLQVTVWLYDGNIRYLRNKHIPLFTAAIVCLVFLFLPYTVMLIFSQWIKAKLSRRIFSWINNYRIKPFLDAYHAPYTDKHRYWTGLMLLVRLVLYLIFAVNALGDPSVNLIAIISTTAVVLIMPTILDARVYKTWSLSLLEMSFVLNINILAVATLYIRLSGGNQNAATFTSVGTAFTTFVGIVVYHSVQQIKGTRLWRRVYPRRDYVRVPLNEEDSGTEDPPDVVYARPAPSQTVVAIRDSELRESCMATD